MNWDTAPDLFTLPEVCALLRMTVGHAHTKLSRGAFPIEPLPDARPYRFPRARVQAYVVRGELSNRALADQRTRGRRYFRRAS